MNNGHFLRKKSVAMLWSAIRASSKDGIKAHYSAETFPYIREGSRIEIFYIGMEYTYYGAKDKAGNLSYYGVKDKAGNLDFGHFPDRVNPIRIM